MEAFSTLKDELLKQKSVIEKMYGTVNVANTNPSPSEITAGIESIPFVNLSDATATELDVKQGKTFYSGDATLKTGIAVINQDEIHALFAYPENTESYEDQIYFSIPEELTNVKRYMFYKNNNNVHITFHENLQIIDEYSFYNTYNFSFSGFNDLKNLTKVGLNAFAKSACEGMNIAKIPDTVATIGDYAFYHVVQEYSDFKLPDSLTSMGQYVFMSNVRQMQNSLDLSNFTLNYLQPYTFYYHAFACDFTTPPNVKTCGTYYNYNGCFKNITITSNVTSVNNYCFGAGATQPIDNFYLKSITFESATPPTFGYTCFATQNLQNGLKIYVPDESIDEYKAITNLALYVDYIYPVSQKP